ncbi:MAG: hypothetical protein HC927_03230 [Deltaproteobacteria bacterium]|nr:hypothetical protein [Deltaproteobacteria bacterium]
MAQWWGQFTGRTHATAIADAEALLAHAIEAYKTATDETQTAKAKAVVRLAKRLLTARRRPLRAKLKDSQAISETADATELQRLEEGGVAAILEEFGCLEALSAATSVQRPSNT